MPGILVVEDDENLNHWDYILTEKSGYEVFFSQNPVKKAKRIASDNNMDVTTL